MPVMQKASESVIVLYYHPDAFIIHFFIVRDTV